MSNDVEFRSANQTTLVEVVDTNGCSDSSVWFSSDQVMEPITHLGAVRFSDGDLHLADRKPAVNLLWLPEHGDRWKADPIELGVKGAPVG